MGVPQDKFWRKFLEGFYDPWTTEKVSRPFTKFSSQYGTTSPLLIREKNVHIIILNRMNMLLDFLFARSNNPIPWQVLLV